MSFQKNNAMQFKMGMVEHKLTIFIFRINKWTNNQVQFFFDTRQIFTNYKNKTLGVSCCLRQKMKTTIGQRIKKSMGSTGRAIRYTTQKPMQIELRIGKSCQGERSISNKNGMNLA